MRDNGASVRHASKLLSIQYLRGAAALSIVVYHAFTQLHRLGFRGENPDILLVGLDIFFVISGFIMWYTTFSRDIGPREFLRHRIVRIVPLYWAITSLYLFIFLAHPEWLQSTQFEFWYVAKSYLFIPAQSPAVPQRMWPVVVPGWSLNYEMFFYCLFAFTLFFAPRTRPGLLGAVLILATCLQFFDPASASIVGFYSSNIVLEFAFGVVLGWLYTNSSFAPARSIAILLVVLGIGGLLADRFVSDVPRALGYGVPALLIVAGAVFYERRGRLRKFNLPKVIGDASYSIYLSHAVVLSALSQLWIGIKVSSTVQIDTWSFFLMSAVAASAICGVLVYRFLERPVLQKLSNQKMHLRPA